MRLLLLTATLFGCVSCGGWMSSRKLPINIRVVDVATHKPIAGARVELQWRCGFQGYYWGEPVVKLTDETGLVSFSKVDIPARSSQGYSLGRKITKLFVSAVKVSADGYLDAVLMYPEKTDLVELKSSKGNQGGAKDK